MPTTYCTVADVSDFLRVPITATTTPNKAQVEKIINRKEEELDRRIRHTFGRNKQVTEVHDLPLHYNFGWGTPIYLSHRNCRDFDTGQGDKIEVWKGSSEGYSEIQDTNTYSFENQLGKLFLRGFLYTIFRDYRVRITYRYGDATVPDDITDACVKLTCIDILNSSFRMDVLPMGGNGVDIQASKADWRADVETCIENRQEVFVIP